MTTKIKDALFITFGKEQLPLINTTIFSKEIYLWKGSKNVSRCFKKLFDQIDENSTYISHILERVWPDLDNVPDLHLAYTIGVCTSFLDLDIESIQMSKSILESKIEENLVSFVVLCK